MFNINNYYLDDSVTELETIKDNVILKRLKRDGVIIISQYYSINRPTSRILDLIEK